MLMAQNIPKLDWKRPNVRIKGMILAQFFYVYKDA